MKGVILMDIMFKDISLLRQCIQILNNAIKEFGYVDIEYMNMVCEIPNYIGKYTDAKFGWRKEFKESENIEVKRLKDETIIFIFRTTEPEEL